MILTKNLRVDELGEPLFEKVNLVIRPGERIGVVSTGEKEDEVLLRAIAGEVEADEGSVTHEGERIAYIPLDLIEEGEGALARVLHARPTFLIINAAEVSAAGIEALARFIRGFRGGILLASEDATLMQAAKVSRIVEIQTHTKTVSLFTGNYADFVIEREKNQARVNAAYEKQQRAKRRLEDWLTQKRAEASINRSPEIGATIRSKTKYLQREILDKEIPKPFEDPEPEPE
ncbi:MAG TPA: hypothetical protein VGB97_02875 [Candidatus Paceibacterota bacterium]|jgi:ATPase subunit of ABC transporter with duplicated ATPase domains